MNETLEKFFNLRNDKWKKVSIGDKVHYSSGEFEVLLPNKSYRDYLSRLYDALNVLTIYYSKEVPELTYRKMYEMILNS